MHKLAELKILSSATWCNELWRARRNFYEWSLDAIWCAHAVYHVISQLIVLCIVDHVVAALHWDWHNDDWRLSLFQVVIADSAPDEAVIMPNELMRRLHVK